MSLIDRVNEAAEALTNLGLPVNVTYSSMSPLEQAVFREFVRACFDAREVLVHVIDTRDGYWYTETDLEEAREDAYAEGKADGYNEALDDGDDADA